MLSVHRETEERLAMCENKNLILQNRICELEQLLKIAPELSDVIVTEQEKVLQNSVSIENLDARLSNIKVNSQRNLNGDSLTNERGIETVTVQVIVIPFKLCSCKSPYIQLICFI